MSRGASVATSRAFDLEGLPISEERQLLSQKTAQPGWSALLGESTIAEMAPTTSSLRDAATSSRSAASATAVERGGLQPVELHHRAIE